MEADGIPHRRAGGGGDLVPAEGGAFGGQGPLQGVTSSEWLLSFPAASPSVKEVEHGQGEPVRGNTGPL